MPQHITPQQATAQSHHTTTRQDMPRHDTARPQHDKPSKTNQATRYAGATAHQVAVGRLTPSQAMAHHGTPQTTHRHDKPLHGTPSQATAWHAMPRHTRTCHNTTCHCTPRHGTPQHGKPRHGTTMTLRSTPSHAPPSYGTTTSGLAAMRHATAPHGTAQPSTARHSQVTEWHSTPSQATTQPPNCMPRHVMACNPARGGTGHRPQGTDDRA